MPCCCSSGSQMASARYGLDKPLAGLRTDLFVPPRVDEGQLSLF